ncbi:MAG: hypothetical protein ACRD3L_17490 [Terriglobales bacterium]
MTVHLVESAGNDGVQERSPHFRRPTLATVPAHPNPEPHEQFETGPQSGRPGLNWTWHG